MATLDDLKLEPEQRKLADFLVTTWSHLRIYGVPPGVPPERLAVLRKAFFETMKSPQLIKDAERQGVIVAPSSWKIIEADMKRLSKTSSQTLAQYKKLAGLK